MSRKRVENAEADTPPEATPVNPEEKKKPVISWRYPTDKTTSIEVSIWPNLITLQNGEQVQAYSVTIQRSYKDQDGNWQRNHSFRGHDLPVLMHALEKAHAWILEQRELNNAF